VKTKGMRHQIVGLRRMIDRKFYGLFLDMGTGKTWMFLADAERLYAAGKIDGLLVIAPKGVHTNWIRREVPKHLGDDHVIARAYSSGMGKQETEHVKQIFRVRDDGEQAPLRILAINYDALITKDGLAFAKSFLRATKAMIVLDESTRIKGIKNRRTEAVMQLKPLSVYRRIASGMPITNAPPDIFAQMEFLEEGRLGTSSYRAFVAEYSQLLPPSHPMIKKMIQKNPRIAFAQIVERDKITNKPIYRNLEKLQALLQRDSYRVLKSECLDLPSKVYKNHYFNLSRDQRAAYRTMEKEFRIMLDDDEFETVAKLNSITKLQQITSGFVIHKDRSLHYVAQDNPRLDAMVEIDQSIDGKYIVWATFSEEIRAVAAALRKAGRKVVEYHGKITSNKAREAAVDDFQEGDADVFIGHPGAGGIGLTLTAARAVVYYSNSYNLEYRIQSEDRAHRIGQKRSVVYIDLVAENTIDEVIAASLQHKENIATLILNPAKLFKMAA
jgi:SNF2 family DNA or RNA helicase